MKLSTFQYILISHIIAIAILVILLLSYQIKHYFIIYAPLLVSDILVLFFMLLFLPFTYGDDLINIFYKIKYDGKYYKSSYLTVGFFYIPYWTPVEDKFFCGFNFGEDYNSLTEAKTSITNHKIKMKQNRKEFCQRPLQKTNYFF